ncbi:hypothetical protein K439DRAFT_1348229, partial [Ramaria rubella]
PWTCERLIQECAIALGYAIELSTAQTYSSHLQSYLTFCKLHEFPVEPTVDTLSFYVVFMAHHIKPASVSAYLSGISNMLEPCVPSIHSICHSVLVSKTLAGMKKLCGGTKAKRKRALTEEDLHTLLVKFDTGMFDNMLFLAMLFTGFYASMRLGELTQADSFAARRLLLPTYSWFVCRLQSVLGSDVAGHSLCSGGATALALAGIANDTIQAMGRWASETFCIYIWKHPVLLQALIHGRSAFNRKL